VLKRSAQMLDAFLFWTLAACLLVSTVGAAFCNFMGG
jgi:hypothetical protein